MQELAMADPEGKICRYFNTLGGCWYGQQCKFLHIPNQKPPCKFFFSASGCRFGDACHFSHDRLPLKSVENSAPESEELPSEDIKAASTGASGEGYQTGTNNNSMYQTAQQFEATETELVDNGVIYCTTCRKMLHRQDSESYYNLLRDHYLECFFEKDADHIKNVRVRASMEFGSLYSCKVCNLVFEKPWSLFQHCTDKATGKAMKSTRFERKMHNEWLDEVAGSMAAYDLGLFPPNQVRDSLRENIAPPAVEEEIETATNALNMCMLLNYMLNGLGMPQGMMPNGSGGGGSGGVNGGAGGGGGMAMQRYQHGRSVSRSTMGGRGGGGPRRRFVGHSQDRVAAAAAAAAATATAAGAVSAPTALDATADCAPDSATSETTTSTLVAMAAAEKKPDPACGDVEALPASPDLSSGNTWGFNKDEVGELLSQGIKPWDPEAPTALAAIRGEFDHLLSLNKSE